MINYKEIGKRIRYYRTTRGITQEELAYKIDTSASYLSSIERATKKPSLTKLKLIAEALGISLEDLVNTQANKTYAFPETDELVCLCSASDKKRLVNYLLGIMNILEQTS